MKLDDSLGILDQRDEEIGALDALIARAHIRVDGARQIAEAMRASADAMVRRAEGEENNLRRECDGVNALVAARERLLDSDTAYRNWATDPTA